MFFFLPQVTQNGASNETESADAKKAAAVDDSDGAYVESEQQMCESLRQNWRKMVAIKRDVLKNRVAEIDVQLDKIRNEMMQCQFLSSMLFHATSLLISVF